MGAGSGAFLVVPGPLYRGADRVSGDVTVAALTGRVHLDRRAALVPRGFHYPRGKAGALSAELPEPFQDGANAFFGEDQNDPQMWL